MGEAHHHLLERTLALPQTLACLPGVQARPPYDGLAHVAVVPHAAQSRTPLHSGRRIWEQVSPPSATCYLSLPET